MVWLVLQSRECIIVEIDVKKLRMIDALRIFIIGCFKSASGITEGLLGDEGPIELLHLRYLLIILLCDTIRHIDHNEVVK